MLHAPLNEGRGSVELQVVPRGRCATPIVHESGSFQSILRLSLEAAVQPTSGRAWAPGEGRHTEHLGAAGALRGRKAGHFLAGAPSDQLLHALRRPRTTPHRSSSAHICCRATVGRFGTFVSDEHFHIRHVNEGRSELWFTRSWRGGDAQARLAHARPESASSPKGRSRSCLQAASRSVDLRRANATSEALATADCG